jgi:Glycosyl transferase family 2
MAEMRAPLPHVEMPFSSRVRDALGLVSLQFNVGRRWSRVQVNPLRPDPALPVRLFGIVTTWCEADVIEATVQNAFAQGCERVFIVDNQSPDDTVKRAEAAGAEIACVYYTDFNDMARRAAEVRNVIDSVSPKITADHLWWLVCDADEFVHGPSGQRIIDYLAGLDHRFRVVGARVFEHFPTSEPANVPGRHPLDYQPLCQELPMAWCSIRHWKHPLVRWDRFGPEVVPGYGTHRARSPVRVHEPREGAFMHHFQYRNRPDTSERLWRLCEPQEDGVVRSAVADVLQRQTSGARRRWATLDYVYSQDWAHVERRTPRGYRLGADPRPWTSLVSPADATVARWYSPLLDRSLARKRTGRLGMYQDQQSRVT